MSTQLIKHTMVYGLSTMIGRLLNYLLVPLYTRVFLPEEYGVVTEFYAYAGFFSVLFLYGMETAFFRFSKDLKNADVVFSTGFLSLLTTSLLGLFLFIFFKLEIYSFVGYGASQYFVEFFIAIIFFDALSALPFAKLRQEGKAMQFASIRLLSIFTNIGFNLYFLLLCPYLKSNGFTFYQLFYFGDLGIAYIFISNLLAGIITFAALLPLLIKAKWAFDIKLFKRMIQYALPLLIVGFAGIVNEIADRLFLKKLLPFSMEENLKWLGIYGANYKLSILISLFTQAYRYAAEPLFFTQSQSKQAPQFYINSMRIFVLIQFILMAAILFHIEGIKYFIGKNYWEGLSVVGILLLANVALGINYNLSVWYKLTDKTLYAAYISLFGAAITIAANYILIPIYGIHGAAYATLICYVSMMLLSVYFGNKFYPISYSWLKLLKWLFIFGLFYFIANFCASVIESRVMIQVINSSLFLLYFLLCAWYELGLKKVLK